VWAKRGSETLAALDALIEKAPEQVGGAQRWQWPPSPAHVPDPADEDMSWVD
jgi:hypothetical protein